MYQEIYDIITARLTSLGFANVGSALADPPPLPAVQIYLNGDKELDATPSPRRELTWVVQLSVGPDSEGAAKMQDLHDSLDIIRNGFSGWWTGITGLTEPCMVPAIKISDHRDHGATQYLVFIVSRVIPATFTV